MRTWYNIIAKENGQAEISIYDEIGFYGVTAKAFITDLQKISAKDILLTVNSPGGSVFDGLAIYNALKNTRDNGAKITARVMGIAASAASFIVMAANEIEMPENSMMMVHYASGLSWGNADTMRETADILDKIDASLVGIYVARTGKPEDEVRALLKAETYMTAQEAKDAGFADKVTENVTASAKFEIDRLPENVRKLFTAAAPANEPGAKAPDAAFADQVEALATAAGMPEFAAQWAVAHTDIATVEAKIADAREVKALCALAKQPNAAAGFIKSNTPVADVRIKLAEALAAQDAKDKTDTTPRNPGTPPAAQPVAIKTGDIWAARRKSTN